MSDRTRTTSPRTAVKLCVESPELSDLTRRRLASTLYRASEFFEGRRITELDGVGPVDADDFIRSRLDSGLPASLPVLHNRRAALRFLFRVARRLELVDGDPTLDLVLPPKSSLSARPLDDGEVELCRDIASWTSPRVAIAWALGETTARGAEIAAITADDLDVGTGDVRIAGGARTAPRTGRLSDWGIEMLRHHIGGATSEPLAYSGEGCGIAGQVSTCRAIGSVLLRAGLAAEPDVRPMSLAAWAGRRVLDETGSIEAVALAMGVRSLDRASRLVGHDWTAV